MVTTQTCEHPYLGTSPNNPCHPSVPATRITSTTPSTPPTPNTTITKQGDGTLMPPAVPPLPEEMATIPAAAQPTEDDEYGFFSEVESPSTKL